jgi:hypothetical protein
MKARLTILSARPTLLMAKTPGYARKDPPVKPYPGGKDVAVVCSVAASDGPEFLQFLRVSGIV